MLREINGLTIGGLSACGICGDSGDTESRNGWSLMCRHDDYSSSDLWTAARSVDFNFSLLHTIMIYHACISQIIGAA